jgi:ubiquinone/menaquinone biosynthesis C-methylase UbiE
VIRLRPTRAAGAEEFLDAPGHDLSVLEHSLRQVATVNRCLGGWRSVLRYLPRFLPPAGPARVLDLGAGSGAGAIVVARWARRHGREVQVTAADRHPQVLEIARRRTAACAGIRVEAADAVALPYPDAAFHAVLMTLTFHHFEGERAVRVLRELARVARLGVIVSDLDRSWANYLGARLLAATVWAGNPLTRNDGPLSVLRAYTANELEALAREAGLPAAHVHRHLFQRLVLVAPAPARPARAAPVSS